MRNIIFSLMLFSAIAYGRTAYQVYRMPPSGNLPGWGTIDLSQSGISVQGVLNAALGGVGAANAKPLRNALFNSGLYFWQRGSSIPVPDNSVTYGPDRWYSVGWFGTPAVVTLSQTTASIPGMRFALQAVVTTPPTVPVAKGVVVCQTFDLITTQLYSGGNQVSLGMAVMGNGNVNQATLYVIAATAGGEVAMYPGRPSSTIVASSAAVVNNSYTFLTLNNVSTPALGSAEPIGFCVAATGVSSGNLSDSGNGISVQAAMLNLGTIAGIWSPKNYDSGMELADCQKFYEKSYDIDTAPGTVTLNGETYFNTGNSTSSARALMVPFKVAKRTNAYTLHTYDRSGAGTTFVTGVNAAATLNTNGLGVTSAELGQSSYYFEWRPTTEGGFVWQWTVDDEIY